MNAYIFETIDNANRIGCIVKSKYTVRVSSGAGVGISRRKLAVTTKRELTRRLTELHDRCVTVMSFSDDAKALAYAKDTQQYLNSQCN